MYVYAGRRTKAKLLKGVMPMVNLIFGIINTLLKAIELILKLKDRRK